MKVADVSAAVDVSGIHPATICASIEHLIPILQTLARGRPFWFRWPVLMVVKVLDQYRKETCP